MLNEETASETAEITAKGPIEAEQKLTARIAELEQALSAKDGAESEAKKTLAAQAADIAALKEGHTAAVAAYRKLAVSANPILTAELVTGNSIPEVDAAIKKVTDLAAGIKSRMEEELKALVVPAGAPGRTAPDLSDLSPREKIKFGLEKK